MPDGVSFSDKTAEMRGTARDFRKPLASGPAVNRPQVQTPEESREAVGAEQEGWLCRS